MKTDKKILRLAGVAGLLFFSSCAFIADVFKAGVGFGVFLVVAAIVLVLVIVARSSKK